MDNTESEQEGGREWNGSKIERQKSDDFVTRCFPHNLIHIFA